MATTRGKGSSLPYSKEGKREKRHHSGRKWYFVKAENGEARTLHHHNKSPILAQDGTDPGSVVHMKPASEDLRKLKVKYSSEKSLLLDVSFFNPTNDLNKQLFREISDISRFGEQVRKLLEVEFFPALSSGKRPANSSSTSGCEENQAKKRRGENESNTISVQPREPFSLGAETLSITASTSTNENVSASVSSVSGASASKSKCLRELNTEQLAELLRSLAYGKLSFA